MTMTPRSAEIRMGPCWQCRGDGFYWRVPDGFNPFYAGGFQTARTMERVHCFRCEGTGRALISDGEHASQPKED